MHPDSDEIARATVWEMLCQSAEAPMTRAQIQDAVPLPSDQVAVAVSALLSRGLLAKSGQGFTAVTALDPLGWAKALEAGIPLFVLEKFSTLSRAQRSEAMRMAASGEVDQEIGRIEREAQEKAAECLRGRAAAVAARTELARMEKDMSDALAKVMSDGDSPVVEVLSQLHARVKGLLDKMVAALSRQGG